MSENTVAVSDSTFKADVLDSKGVVLVDFWAEWCGPCKAIGPALEEIAGELKGRVVVAKVNVDDNPMTPSTYRVQGIPTAGDLLFSEAAQQVVRRVTPAGVLSTVAGTGTQGFSGDGGPATAAMLDTPGALALDAAGDLYVADTHNQRIRRVDAGTGVLTTVLGGVSVAAMTFDASGRLLYAESAKHQVWRLDLGSGATTLVVGSGMQGFGGDGGPAAAAELDTPAGLGVDAAGDLLVADAHNHRVRRVDASTGVIMTLAVSESPRGLVVDAAGNVVFADRVLNQVVRVSPSGAVTVVAGTGREAFAGDGGPAVRRALLQPLFSPRRVRALQPRVEELTAALLDDLARRGSPADLHQALALPLPMQVICELLGVPYADNARFYGWMEDAAAVGNGAPAQHALGDLFDYALKLVARKREQPADDAVSRLCADESLSDDDVAKLTLRLLFVGQETTVVAIGMGILYLLAHPDQRQALVDDPGQIPGAVEEILRGSVRGLGGVIPRYARTDVQIGDVTVPAGDLVLMDTRAANHDPGVFACPVEFDITRNGPEHLSFGYGNRYCLGAPLARIELQAVLSQLPARFPAMQLTVPLQQIRLREGGRTGTELPVEW